MHAAGTDLIFETLAYPLTAAAQAELVQLLRTEWTHADYDWREAMDGEYSSTLVIASVLVRRHGTAVATATIHFARHRPEVAVIGSVLTHPDHRGRGFAGCAIELALTLAADAGCRVCLLGTTMKPRNLYHRHGFAWVKGAVMRRDFDAGDVAADYFAAGQNATIREATWGDLPGLTWLLAQPLAIACPDYLRGLISMRCASPERCLSNFPVLWYDTAARGGMLTMLADPEAGRVFGFGSMTRAPGPARRHTATVDFATHQNYEEGLPSLLAHLLEGCRDQGIQRAHAWVADGDSMKWSCLRDGGFREVARLPAALVLAGMSHDAMLLDKAL